MPKEKITVKSLIGYGLSAAIWIALLVETFIYKRYEESLGSLILRIFAVIFFTVKFIKEYIAFISKKIVINNNVKTSIGNTYWCFLLPYFRGVENGGSYC